MVRENIDLESYYSYRSIVEAIHHYDIDESAGKELFYYHDPETGQWSVHPWDLDLTWANNMYGGGHEPFRVECCRGPSSASSITAACGKSAICFTTRNRPAWRSTKSQSASTRPGSLRWWTSDRAMWDYNPILVSPYVNSSKAGNGRVLSGAPTKDFAGMMQIMKNYIVSRGSYIDTTLLTDEAQVPQKPTINYTGQAGFPADASLFNTSRLFEPRRLRFCRDGMRVAEITDPSNPNYDPAAPTSYEITPTWESGRQTTFPPALPFPATACALAKRIASALRYQDAAGRWSHWSQPVQFIAAAPIVAAQDKIRVAEINYNPAPSSAAEIAAGFGDKESFEFIEVKNIHTQPVNLAGYQFTQGVEFVFPSLVLQPGQSAVVVNDVDAFHFRYGHGVTVAGEFDDGQLNNAGERLLFMTGGGQPVVDFTYDDIWYPEIGRRRAVARDYRSGGRAERRSNERSVARLEQRRKLAAQHQSAGLAGSR